MIIHTTMSGLRGVDAECKWSYPWYCTGGALTSALPGCIMSQADLDALDKCNYSKIVAVNPTLATEAQNYWAGVADAMSSPDAPGGTNWWLVGGIGLVVLLLLR